MGMDARALDRETLTALRKQGVAAVAAGRSPAQVAAALGVHLTTVFRWLARYRRGGWDQLNVRKRGGRPPKLDGKAVRWIYNTIATKTPQQSKIPFALWTAAILQAVILDQFEVKLSQSSVNRLLHRLGLTVQRSLWRAYHQDPETIERWLRVEYPAICQRAKREGAVIFFADEAEIRPASRTGTTWGSKGKTPVLSRAPVGSGIYLLSAVNAQSQLRFMISEERITAKVFVEFLRRLLVNAPKPIFVILDGQPVHRARAVQRFRVEQQGRITLFLLPLHVPRA